MIAKDGGVWEMIVDIQIQLNVYKNIMEKYIGDCMAVLCKS